MIPEWLYHLMTSIGGAAALYAGIRADLARLHEKSEHAARAADVANQRIDQILSRQNV